jgi:hypothetical protein|tara:strand:- start:277 stop:483 length:207 start_codon:yes stop_codon:yes gene_type:complete
MISKRPIMSEYMSERNKHELDGYGQYYEMGIKKLASFKNAKHRAKKISMIAEGIELAEMNKDFKSIYR